MLPKKNDPSIQPVSSSSSNVFIMSSSAVVIMSHISTMIPLLSNFARPASVSARDAIPLRKKESSSLFFRFQTNFYYRKWNYGVVVKVGDTKRLFEENFCRPKNLNLYTEKNQYNFKVETFRWINFWRARKLWPSFDEIFFEKFQYFRFVIHISRVKANHGSFYPDKFPPNKF